MGIYDYERLTPLSPNSSAQIAPKKGIHILVDYKKGSGTETSIKLKVQYMFSGDIEWRDREYLDMFNISRVCEEEHTLSEFHTFISAPVMQLCTFIRVVATFTDYTSGSYGDLYVSFRKELEIRP